MHRNREKTIAKHTGEMAEWSIAAVLKTVELKGSWGSNPYLSAEKRKSLQVACRDFLRLRHCVPGLLRAIREYRRGSVYLLRLISLLPFQTVSQDIR